MKLELFDFIDETLKLIEENKDDLEKVAETLEKFFMDSFSINDHFLNVNYRIKSLESLKEKILRHNFYIKYKTPENLFQNLSDLIGLRIECRFIEDENKIYKDILKLFNIKEDDGYYSNSLNSNIMLRLDEKQPQKQKNGFEIYKIDGKYSKNGMTVNFELQIKSLVNVFWGEIDHKILYKNFNYMLTEGFFRDIMSSIKDNLAMIDRQLMLVYNHLNDMDASNSATKKSQLEALLSKIIHDIYIVKVRQEIGFVVDFKKSTDVIVNYISTKDGPEESENYSPNFLRILNRLNDISRNEISFNNYINFERNIYFEDNFCDKIGNSILKIINKDFRWNLLFRIIFEIEEGNNAEDFEGFIRFIKFRFYENIITVLENKELSKEDKDEITNSIMDAIANCFSKETDIDFINNCSINSLNNNIEKIFRSVNDYEDWRKQKEKILEEIMNYNF
ncbi:(p)ppGpp synthetase [Tissierella sp. MSJ-40]|uniref:(P)ppGpp synthetase n=1 Tax=Tissierella simiarum TaxID=2841534 RepID=A0ABS6E371_9FIRM|nr:(p)ppGpp synthetase [Tissierella simiarum]MBU5437345.1 (p)ppGpp synthetase [Tissierella simiarum]